MPSLSQMPPRGTISGTAETGHQAGSSQELHSPLEQWWLWGLETFPSLVRLGGTRPRCGHGNGSRGECVSGRSWQRGNTYSSTIRLLFTISDLASALAPLLLI